MTNPTDEQQGPELLPCPCGAKAGLIAEGSDAGDVQCSRCTFSASLSDWNQRANLATPSLQDGIAASHFRGEVSYEGDPEDQLCVACGKHLLGPSEQPHEEALKRFSEFTQGWDSYSGLPISPRAIEIARLLAPVLPDWHITPCSDGNIQFEKSANGYDDEIVIDSSPATTQPNKESE